MGPFSKTIFTAIFTTIFTYQKPMFRPSETVFSDPLVKIGEDDPRILYVRARAIRACMDSFCFLTRRFQVYLHPSSPLGLSPLAARVCGGEDDGEHAVKMVLAIFIFTQGRTKWPGRSWPMLQANRRNAIKPRGCDLTADRAAKDARQGAAYDPSRVLPRPVQGVVVREPASLGIDRSRPEPMAMTMPPDRPNPILRPGHDPLADPTAIRRGHITLVRERRREMRDARRQTTAAEAVADLEPDGREIFGLTRGQFSLVDLVDALLEHTGPAAMTVCTWTAAGKHVARLADALAAGRITSGRWIVDISFVRRCPQEAAAIRQAFGMDAIRVTKTHAKFLLLTNDRWQLVTRTSMNLNVNPRLENFTVAHDPELADFLSAAVNDLWRSQAQTLADDQHHTINRWWQQNG